MILQREFQKILNHIFSSPSNDSTDLSGYSYYAFISYTEKDEKWAEWLQWKIEHYNIPINVRKENKTLPHKVKPIFWYKNDLSGTHLIDAIKKELEQSKYLIVVCSPASADSDWVNEEVDYFKNHLNRGEKIIPFIVDGEINAENPKQECLPKDIRGLDMQKELRCIDVRKYGKNKALVNIISSLLNIRFDILWDRFKRERQKHFLIYSILTLLLMVIMFCGWDYFFHTKYDYYVDIEDCNGVPTGINKVDDSRADEYYRLYRFEYRKRMLQRVVYVDYNGNPMPHINSERTDRPSIQELSYNNGELSSITCKDATNKTIYIMHLSKDKLAVDLKDEDENQGANFILSSTSVDQGQHLLQQSSYLDRFLTAPSKIARYIYERDADGYIIRKMFARNNGDNDDISMDINGISGFEYERDSLHRVVRIRFLDKNYQYKANRLGVAGKRYEYDEAGNLIVADYLDKEGNLKYNEFHWAKAVCKYDENGYIKEESLYGVDNKPCISVQGYHKIIFTYNNDEETLSLYDVNEKPTYLLQYGDNPGGYSRLTHIKNKRGEIVEKHFMDSEGNLCYNHFHQAIIKYEYNDDGLNVGFRNFGVDKEPCINREGTFHNKFSYNQKGMLTEISFYAKNGLRVQNNYGIHRLLFKYDNTHKRVTEIHSYGMENLPTYNIFLNGASWVKFTYKGSSKWVSDISFYDVGNKPFETVNGAKISYERNHYGQIMKAKNYCYNEGEYELPPNHYYYTAIVEFEHNDMGMRTDWRYFDKDNRPNAINGVSHISNSYSKTGLLEKICHYDTLGNLTPSTEGWAKQEFYYSDGFLIAKSFYGKGGIPIEIDGVHRFEYEIDECGYTLSQSSYNKDMQPALNSNAVYKIVNMFDDNRRNIGLDYYNAIDSEPFVCIRLKYNKRGMVTEQSSYNNKGELIESDLNYGVAEVKWEYDSQDRLTYISATNRRGEKMNTNLGFTEAFIHNGNNMQEYVSLDSYGTLTNNAMANSYAYLIMYMTDTGERLYTKGIKVSDDMDIKIERFANYYDVTGQQIQKTIYVNGDMVTVYDVATNQTKNLYSFEDEYDEYIHIIDSIEDEVARIYSEPKYYNYVSKYIQNTEE